MTTVPQTLGFFSGQVQYMMQRGFEVHVVSSPGPELEHFADREGVVAHSATMKRAIDPIGDISAVLALVRIFREIRPVIVHAHTPKAGLLGMIAASAVGVPVRIYHIHGFPYLTARGVKRHLLQLTERVSCRLAHQVLCVSNSVRDVAVDDRICSSGVAVLGQGSINGVDAELRFNPACVEPSSRAEFRVKYGLSEGALAVGFVGRIVRDKGISELAQAWSVLREQFSDAHLFVVGELESRDAITSDMEQLLRQDSRIHLTGPMDDMPQVYSALDLVVLPSYREGFPVVPLEAAAMGLPVIATDVPGCREAVIHDVTGLLVPARDADALARAICLYVSDAQLRRRHGAAGRERVRRDFAQQPLWEAQFLEYERLLDRQDAEGTVAHEAGA